MNVFKTLQPEQNRNLGFLFASGLLFWSSLASMLPTLPLYIKDAQATDFQIGVVMGAFAVGLVLFRPWLGRVADQVDRKWVLYIGLFAVATAPLGYLATQSIPILFLLRAFHGLSIAAFTTAFSALVADLSPPQSRGEIIGYMTLVNPLGVAIGPAMGGFLQEWVGYTPLFLVSAGLGFAGMLFTHQLHTPPTSPAATASPATKQPFWQLILSPRLRIPALVLSLIGVAFGTLAIFVPLFIKETGAGVNPGLFYTVAAIGSFTARIVVGRASDRLGRGRFISIGLLCYGISLALLALAHTPGELLIPAFIEGVGGGIVIPMMIALTADRSQPHERGQVFGVTLAGFDLGMALAGPVFGFLASQLGYRSLFSITSILAFLALVIFASLGNKNVTYSLKFALGGGRDLYAFPKV